MIAETSILERSVLSYILSIITKNDNWWFKHILYQFFTREYKHIPEIAMHKEIGGSQEHDNHQVSWTEHIFWSCSPTGLQILEDLIRDS